LVTTVSYAKTAEPIEMPFEEQTRVDPVDRVLDERTYWRHLANMIERFVLGSSTDCRYRYCVVKS